MVRLRTLLAVSVMSLSVASMNASAKRAAPVPVPPVSIGGIEYRAPVERVGCVEAWDVATGEMIWWRQVYTVVHDPKLEQDVQDVFIVSIKPDNDGFLIGNERGDEYWLDRGTLEVKARKGAVVVRAGRDRGRDGR